jgi:hypothetical protein
LENSPEGRALLTDIDVALGQTDRALLQLQQELKRNPANEAAAVRLTRLFLELGRLEDARRAAMLRHLSHPASAGALFDLLSIEWELQRLPEYERTVADLLTRHATDARALSMLANFAAGNGLPALADRVLATARDQNLPEDYYLGALLLAQCSAGEYPNALATAEALDEIDPLPPPLAASAMLLKGWAYLGLGNATEGEPLIQRALLLPQLPVGHALKVAPALEKLGAISAAERTYAAAVERTPGEATPLLALVNFLAQHDKWGAAAERLPQLLALAEPPQLLVATIQAKQAEAQTAAQALAEARATAAAQASLEVRAEAAARAEEAARVTADIRARVAEEAARLIEADRAARAAAAAKAEAEAEAAAASRDPGP